MIRVTVELVSAVDASRNRTLGVMEIANDGKGDAEVSNYDVVLHAEYTPAGIGRQCRVEGFRRQRQSVWSLIGAALKCMGHTKHPLSKTKSNQNASTETKAMFPLQEDH